MQFYLLHLSHDFVGMMLALTTFFFMFVTEIQLYFSTSACHLILVMAILLIYFAWTSVMLLVRQPSCDLRNIMTT